MGKSAIAATATMKESERLSGVIANTEARLTVLDEELSLIDREHDRLAAAEELDTEALESLRARSATILAEKDTLTRRVSALTTKQRDAERQEAGTRLEQIVDEAGALLIAEGKTLPAYARGVDALKAAVSALVEIHRQHRELNSEAVYLVDLFGFDRQRLPQLGELPDINSLVATLAQLFAPVSSFGFDSIWVRKRQELNSRPELRRRPQKEPAPVQVSTSQPLPARETRMIPARPQEDEPAPNKLQQMLRG